jgi:DNA-binding MarR family transcriptional regulator
MTNRQRFPDGHDKVAAGVLEAKASGGAVGCSHMKLRRLTRLISRHYDAHLSKCGLKTTQYSMLAIIADRGPLQQGELARVLSLDASTLTRNLRPLLEAGLVSVDAGRDARSRQVSATAAGRDLRMQARQYWKQAQLAFSTAIGAERVAALHDLVDDCYQTLVAADGGD